MPAMTDPATGRLVEVPLDQVAQAIRAGFTVEVPGEQFGRLAREVVAERTSGVGPGVEAFAAGVLRGGTLGLSDVAISVLGTEEDAQRLAELRRERPGLSLAGEVAGGVGTALATAGTGAVGTAARLTPSGAVAGLGARIFGASEGAGTLARVAAGTAAGAVEGAAGGAGAYLTEIALEDKPLSAEGFLASAKQGALWGGVAGGSLAAGERALVAARRLFPRSSATREAAAAAEREAVDEIDSALRDSDAMEEVANRRIREVAETRRITDPAVDAAIREAEAPIIPPTPQGRTLADDEIGALISGRGLRRAGQAPAPVAGDLEATLRASLEQPRAPTTAATPTIDTEQARRLLMRERAKETLVAAKRARGELPPAEVAPTAAAPDVADADVIEFGRGFGQLDDDASREAIRKWQTSTVLQKNARTQGLWKEWATPQREQLEKVIESGRLPRDARLYRGAGPAFDSSHLKPGSVVSSEGFLATSTSRDVAETFATLGKPQRGVIGTLFEVDGKAGTPSAWASSRPGEREVLFGPRSRLRVTDVRTEQTEDGLMRIVRAQIEPRAGAGGGPLERQLGGTLEHVRGGGELGAAPHVARRQALDKIDEIVARMDPQTRVLVDAKRDVQMTAQEVRSWVESMRRIGGAGTMKAAPRPGIIGAAAPDTAADAVATALRVPARSAEATAADITETLGRYEAANANLAEALGDAAPPSAVKRAQVQREVADAGAEVSTRTAANAADAIERSAATEPSMLGRVADMGAAYEVMRAMGVPLPSPSAIPVIGPLLGLYLKARAASTIFRRLGGKIPRSAEAMIAEGATATRNRVHRAVDGMLGIGARAARGARAAGAPRWAGVLSHSLFDDGEKQPSAAARGKEPDEPALVRARVSELARAERPGAVQRVMRARFPLADPGLVDEMTSALERRFAYLRQHAPVPPSGPTVLRGGRSDWTPSRAETTSFARRIEAADDPAAVLERMADTGDISVEAAETIRAVYPRLFMEAQMRLVQTAAELKDRLPYSRRAALSMLFDVPLDGTTDPDYVAFLQSGYKPAAAAAAPPGALPGGAPPTPSIASDVFAGDRATLRIDR